MARLHELTGRERTKRLLQAQEGLICIDCGKSLLGEQQHYDAYTCDECMEEDIAHTEAEMDYLEYRSYDEDGMHVRLIDRDTKECFSEYTVVEVRDAGTPESIQAVIDYYKNKNRD